MRSRQKRHRFFIFTALFCGVIAGSVPISRAETRLGRDIIQVARDLQVSVPSGVPTLVLDFRDQDDRVSAAGRYLADQLTIALVDQANVSVVDRAVVKAALKEKKLAEAGLIRDDTAVQVGRMTGARLAVCATMNEFPKLIALNIKVIDIQTGVVIGGVSRDIKRTRDVASLFQSLKKREVFETEPLEISSAGVSEARMQQVIKDRILAMNRQAKPVEVVSSPNEAVSVWDRLQLSVEESED